MDRRDKTKKPKHSTVIGRPNLFGGFVFETGGERRELTEQEERIVKMLCEGMTNEEIVKRMSLCDMDQPEREAFVEQWALRVNGAAPKRRNQQ